MKSLLPLVLFLAPSLLFGQSISIEAGINTVYGLKSRQSRPYWSDVTPGHGAYVGVGIQGERSGLIKNNLQFGLHLRSYAYAFRNGGVNSFTSQNGEIDETSVQLHWYLLELNPTHQWYLQSGLVAGGGLNVRNSYFREASSPMGYFVGETTEISGLKFSPQLGLSVRTYYLFPAANKDEGWYPQLQLDYVFTSLPELIKTSYLVGSFGLGYRF